MVELIATIILAISLIGMSVILIRKIPILSELSPQKIEGPGILGKLKNKVKSNRTLKTFSGEILLQKILSKVRILTLKTDKRTSTWLRELRQKSLKKKNNFSDDYWKKIKKEK